ncbi:MAG: DEAD/DEAH box helicase [Bdellovibrionales bacterium]
MQFKDYQLTDKLLKNIEAMGFDTPTPIQEKVLEPGLRGGDISGLAQTGTGKTVAFLLPVLNRLLNARDENFDKEANPNMAFKSWGERSFCLILVPTRELTEQVKEECDNLTKDCGIRSAAILGGVGYDKQKKALADGVEILIATPGRLIDLYKDNVLDLKQCKAIIFDEADRMFDMGFKDDMKYLLRRIPEDRQFMVFSATMNLDVLTVAYQFGADPIEVHLKSDSLKAENVKDELFHVSQGDKPKFLLSLIKKYEAKQVIIFSNYKHQVMNLCKFLASNDLPAVGISSIINQQKRQAVLEQFKSENKTNILVATDLAARGLDIVGVDLVINYDLPDDSENYVHRIGRTGRAGAMGNALSLVSDRDVEALQRLESFLGNKVEIGWIEDSDLITEFIAYQDRRDYKTDDKRSFDRKGKRGDRKSGERSDRTGNRDNKRGGKPRSNSKRHEAKDGSTEARRSPNPNRNKAKSTSIKKKTGVSTSNTTKKASSGNKTRKRRSRKKKPETLGGKVKSFIKNIFS